MYCIPVYIKELILDVLIHKHQLHHLSLDVDDDVLQVLESLLTVGVGLSGWIRLVVVVIDLIRPGRGQTVDLSLQPLYLTSLGLDESQEVLQAGVLHADIEVSAVITEQNCAGTVSAWRPVTDLGPVTVSLGSVTTTSEPLL